MAGRQSTRRLRATNAGESPYKGVKGLIVFLHSVIKVVGEKERSSAFGFAKTRGFEQRRKLAGKCYTAA